ncbi:MAG TPA: hypothetical protein VE594_04410 [Nitrososphaeraceae archaeon]|nr:hypothetical protein [Nitrososphaeraceae archaeon]
MALTVQSKHTDLLDKTLYVCHGVTEMKVIDIIPDKRFKQKI